MALLVRPRQAEPKADDGTHRLRYIAAALLLAALFGFLGQSSHKIDQPRNAQSARGDDQRQDVSMRDPVRAILSSDRQDAKASYQRTDDGAVIAHGNGAYGYAYRFEHVTLRFDTPQVLKHRSLSSPRGPPPLA